MTAICHHHEPAKAIAHEQDGDVQVFRLPVWKTLLYTPICLSAYSKLKKLLTQCAPDIIHLHMPNPTCFWLLFLPIAKQSRWIIHWHSDVIGERPDWRVKLFYPFYALFETALLKRADKVIVTSPNYLASSIPLKKFIDKCTVIPLGIPEEVSSVEDHTDNIRTNREGLKVLCVGRLTYYKGQQFLIQAISQLQGHINLTFIGQGEERDCLQSVIDNEAIEHEIEFLEGLSDTELFDKLNECDVLCLPSIERTEAFGVVLLEAMRAGKPCIVTDVPGSGMSWVIKHDYNGLVVPAADVDALASALAMCLGKPEQRKMFGENGRRRFSKNFTIQKVSNQILRLYQNTRDAE